MNMKKTGNSHWTTSGSNGATRSPDLWKSPEDVNRYLNKTKQMLEFWKCNSQLDIYVFQKCLEFLQLLKQF